MNSSFDLPEVRSFAVGTEGPPGRRVFYLQAVSGDQVITLRLEKQQVALLADYLERLLTSYEFEPATSSPMPELISPLLPEWTVGSMMVAIDEARGKVVVIAEELDLSDPDVDDDDDDDLDDDEDDGSQARICLDRGQVEAFVIGARDVIAGGRPSCRFCGGPIDPDGHMCPRMN